MQYLMQWSLKIYYSSSKIIGYVMFCSTFLHDLQWIMKRAKKGCKDFRNKRKLQTCQIANWRNLLEFSRILLWIPPLKVDLSYLCGLLGFCIVRQEDLYYRRPGPRNVTSNCSSYLTIFPVPQWSHLFYFLFSARFSWPTLILMSPLNH